MKRNYKQIFILFLLITTGSLFAQRELPGPVLPGGNISLDQLRTRFQSVERTTVGEWLFFDAAYEGYFFTTPIAGYVNYLFPDSTMQTNPSAPFPTWSHAVGQAYDLTSPAWATTNPGVANIDYTLLEEVE